MNTVSINQLSTLRWSFEEDAEAYQRHGFSGLGIYRPKLEDFGLDRAIELLAEFQLEPTSLSWIGGFTGSDGRPYTDAIADGMEAICDAEAIGVQTLIVLAGGRNSHTQPCKENALRCVTRANAFRGRSRRESRNRALSSRLRG